LARPTSSSLGW